MSEKDTGSFRLGTFEETQDMPKEEDRELVDLQIRKLHRRSRWFLVIILLVAVGLFSAGYLDLKKRFSLQQTSGTREIENIAAVFEDRLNEFQKRMDALETSFAKEMEALDQKTVVWQKDLAGLRQTVEKLDLTGVVKKEQKAVLQSVRKELEPMDRNIQSLKSELTDLEKKMAAQLAPLSESLSKNTQEVQNLQKRIGPAFGEIVNKDQMDLELLKIKKAYRQNLTAEISGLEKQIRLLKERLERLEATPAPQAAGPAGRQPSSSTGAGGTGIDEQNLP
jgi:hypothetical protein